MTTGEDTGPVGRTKVFIVIVGSPVTRLKISLVHTSRTSSVDQEYHLSLFGVFLQDSLDLRTEIYQWLCSETAEVPPPPNAKTCSRRFFHRGIRVSCLQKPAQEQMSPGVLSFNNRRLINEP